MTDDDLLKSLLDVICGSKSPNTKIRILSPQEVTLGPPPWETTTQLSEVTYTQILIR